MTTARTVRGSRRASTVLLLTTAALQVVFLIGLLIVGHTINPVVNIWIEFATQWVPVAIFWLVVARVGFARLEVLFAAGAVTVSALGDTYYSFAMDADGYLASPSLADLGYLLFYPLMIAALVVVVARQRVRNGRIALLEVIVAFLGAASVLAALLGPVIVDDLASGDVIASAIATAYPVLDVLLIAAIVGTMALPGLDLGPRWGALIAGLAVFAGADVVSALVGRLGDWMAGTPIDAAWALGLALLALWVDGFGRGEKEAQPRRVSAASLRIVLPALAIVAGLGILVFGPQAGVATVALALAAATVGLAAIPILFRQVMLSRVIAAQDEVVTQLTVLDKAKSDMMMTMNHEFRTPLTSMRGYLEVLIDGHGGDLPESATTMLTVVDKSAARLQALVDQMLLVSRIDSDELLLDHVTITVADVLERAVESVAEAAHARGVAVEVVVTDKTLSVAGDPTLVERAVTNILDNGVKFSAAGAVVKVEAARDDAVVVVRVIDAGIGVPPDDLHRLFTRFFRASNVQNAAVPGSGLGLTIAQGIVVAHGGTVAIESVLGAGTTVTVRIPADGAGSAVEGARISTR